MKIKIKYMNTRAPVQKNLHAIHGDNYLINNTTSLSMLGTMEVYEEHLFCDTSCGSYIECRKPRFL
jgi:hypothetical protein